jgi:hypothetical protein
MNRNCVVRSELTLVAEIVLSVVNYLSLPNSGICSKSVFAAEVCCLQQINVRCLISIVNRESVFSDDSGSLVNLFSLTKFCSKFTYLKWPSD